MPLQTTIGQVLVNESLPPELRDYNRSLVGSELDDLLAVIGREHPEKYRDITHQLMQLGRETAFREGTTMSVSDLDAPEDIRREVIDHVEKQEKIIRADKTMTPAEKQEALGGVYGMAQKLIVDQTYQKALESKNPLALQVLSKARGNPMQLAAMLATPATFSDAKGRPIPVFVRRSYAEGLKPWEYYAATFGARQAVISTKFATRDAGDLGKQMNVISEGLMVTEDDCGTTNGIPVKIDDPDNVGALLARDTGPFKMGTPVTPKVTKELQSKGYKKLLLRSPVVCQARNGLCKHCVGLREDGKLPSLRDAVGVKASGALAERLAQGALNVKHTGGQKEKGEERVYAGFDIINQLAQVPTAFRHAATLAGTDGEVSSVEPAPQGGTNIIIGDETFYVDPEQVATVKVGDKVEAGDQMSTGIVNPAEVVKYKGIGEGRRYFAERLTKAFNDSKVKASRRNVEVLARALIDHVEIEDPEGLGDYLPGDVASYSGLAYGYRPRGTSTVIQPDKALGQYLEQPVLQHTIGTKVTRRMLAELKEFGVDKVRVHQEPPAFVPQMTRLQTAAQYGNDWLAKLHGTYLKSNLLSDVQAGSESNIHGTHPVPALAYGVEFGESRPGKVTY
jgi:DNA-directed RNA polymerase subunit beta'